MKKNKYPVERLAGSESEQTDYILEAHGDIGDPNYGRGYKFLRACSFRSLDEALIFLEENFADKLDPEDDRVLVWEVLPSGHKRVVWHFSGWHWEFDEFNALPQGCFVGHPDSVYAELLSAQ